MSEFVRIEDRRGNRLGWVGGMVMSGAMVGEGGYIIAVWGEAGEEDLLCATVSCDSIVWHYSTCTHIYDYYLKVRIYLQL